MHVFSLRIPLFTAVAEDIGRDINVIFYQLTIALTLLVLAMKIWGLVALVMTALALVPVIFLLLFWVTLP